MTLRARNKITLSYLNVLAYPGSMADIAGIARRFDAVRGVLDERSRRLVAAAESVAVGRGGISAVSRATGISRQVIRLGVAELSEVLVPPPGRVRRSGGGRKTTISQDASLLRDLESLVEPTTRGDPESPLRWTCKSLRNLAEELQRTGHRVSHQLVAGCCTNWVTVCRPTARRWKAVVIRIAMRSSNTSIVE
jgi:hypothetical protein